jgi:hypothetical protein
MSQDKITDTRGNHLIDICVGNQLRILNGRLAGDSFGKFYLIRHFGTLFQREHPIYIVWEMEYQSMY